MGPIKSFISVLAVSTLVNAAAFIRPVNPIMERPLPTSYANSVLETTAVAPVPAKSSEPDLVKEIVGETAASIPIAIPPTSSALGKISADHGLRKKTVEAISATATPNPPSGEKAAPLDTEFWKKAIAVEPKFWKKSAAPSTTATSIDTASPTPNPPGEKAAPLDTEFWKKAIAVEPKFWKKSVAPSTTATSIGTASPTLKPAALKPEDTAFW